MSKFHKPHIYKSAFANMWACVGRGRFVKAGYGATPRTAYLNWLGKSKINK